MLREFSAVEATIRALKGPQFDRKSHGGLFDRGTADSYYGRGQEPHWWPQGTHNGVKVTDLTSEEVTEYLAGYQYNERWGDKKSWD